MNTLLASIRMWKHSAIIKRCCCCCCCCCCGCFCCCCCLCYCCYLIVVTAHAVAVVVGGGGPAAAVATVIVVVTFVALLLLFLGPDYDCDLCWRRQIRDALVQPAIRRTKTHQQQLGPEINTADGTTKQNFSYEQRQPLREIVDVSLSRTHFVFPPLFSALMVNPGRFSGCTRRPLCRQ